eukprot:GFKZ01005064.1.p1 GENE.GFKZ01005064.1~~GFKZ01005064.1.p1  ORF type:complete len:207 (+),score=6.31 GFKZ01005064.1:560-1180(+)
MGGTNTRPSMADKLVGTTVLAKISADHFRFDLHRIENLAVIHTNDRADHLRHDDHLQNATRFAIARQNKHISHEIHNTVSFPPNPSYIHTNSSSWLHPPPPTPRNPVIAHSRCSSITHISQMGLYHLGLFMLRSVLLRLIKFLNQCHRLASKSAVELSTGTGRKQRQELNGLHGEKRIEVDASKRELLERAALALDGGFWHFDDTG